MDSVDEVCVRVKGGGRRVCGGGGEACVCVRIYIRVCVCVCVHHHGNNTLVYYLSLSSNT